MMRKTITGELKCIRTARHHNGKNFIDVMIKDAIKPLPPYEMWFVITAEPNRVNRGKQYQLKSRRLPKAFSLDMEGKKITFTATVVEWHNKLGYYMSQVRNVHLAE